ncbi:nucleotide sugar dehydrogenase [Ekhidna sp.]|uniref:nucleotide sugar dehydrogenase n=1 Tax=Ekhidna sp. TaxID=2608089 RepID=UPI00329A05E5
MTISVFGLGYVGIVSSACFARDGLKVIGVDVSEEKVANINKGIPPIIESGLTELLKSGVESGRISATMDISDAVKNSDISLISVGTPSREDGALDLSYVNKVCHDIAKTANVLKKDHCIIIRSTIFPGTTERLTSEIKEKFKDISLHIAFNPEFLREGTAIRDFDDAAYTVIGSTDEVAIKYTKKLYATIDAPDIVMKPSEAELIKYAANSWHATKIAFANEIGRIGKFLDIDSRRVMEVLVSDKKLNTSKAYMRPGFAYGGSCLPKDVRAIDYYSKVNNIDLPLMSSLAKSNQSQIDLATSLVLKSNPKKVGILGLAFKSGTDDLRESPAVDLAEKLLSKGIDLKILDPAVQESKLIGSNLGYINSKIPHLSNLIVNDSKTLVEHSDLIVVTHGAAEFREILNHVKGKVAILDLSGIIKDGVEYSKYEGIAW